jgi:hypothetical protein
LPVAQVAAVIVVTAVVEMEALVVGRLEQPVAVMVAVEGAVLPARAALEHQTLLSDPLLQVVL